MHEHGVNLIKMKLEIKETRELTRIWENRDTDRYNSNTIEAVRRILKERDAPIVGLSSD